MEKTSSKLAAQLSRSRKRFEKHCEHCGGTFQGLKIARYCSESCKQKAKYLRTKRNQITRKVPLSKQLGLSRPYDWSNKNVPENTFALLVLQGCYIPDIARTVSHLGVDVMHKNLERIDDALTRKIASRQLANTLSALERNHAEN